MKSLPCLLLLALLGAAPSARADETPETLLIRQSLDNDKFGRRRGDAELALSACGERMVVFAGNRTADPRGWSVLHEDRAAYGAALAADLRARRYDIERSVPVLQVRGLVAFVATVDSGTVVDRGSGAARPYRSKQLWTFAKLEGKGKWLATALLEDVGDSLAAVPAAGPVDGGIAQALAKEAAGWQDRDADAIAGALDRAFIGFDGTGQFKPETWLIIFSTPEEMKSWAEKRIEHTTSQIQRQVVYTAVGPQGREALALTREQMDSAYKAGPVRRNLDRYVLWTLSRESGNWRVTNMLYDLGLPK